MDIAHKHAPEIARCSQPALGCSKLSKPSARDFLAAQARRLAIMNDLAEHGCKLISTPANSYSLLQNSSMGGCSEVVVFLLAHGAKIDFNDPNSATALNWACQSGDLKTVDTLLDKGAKVNSSPNQNLGFTELMQTAIMGVQYPNDPKYVAITKRLIEQGANVDQTNGGFTALTYIQRSPRLVLTPIVQEMINSLKAACHTLP